MTSVLLIFFLLGCGTTSTDSPKSFDATIHEVVRQVSVASCITQPQPGPHTPPLSTTISQIFNRASNRSQIFLNRLEKRARAWGTAAPPSSEGEASVLGVPLALLLRTDVWCDNQQQQLQQQQQQQQHVDGACDPAVRQCLPALWLPQLSLFPPGLLGILPLPSHLRPTLPTAFFIGTSKCGTTTVKVALRQLESVAASTLANATERSTLSLPVAEALSRAVALEGGGSEQHSAQGFYDSLDHWAAQTTWASPRQRRRDKALAGWTPPPPPAIHYCPSDLTSLHAMASVAFAVHSARSASTTPAPPMIILVRDPVERTLSSLEFKAQSPRAAYALHKPESAYQDVYTVLAVSLNNTQARQQCLVRELSLLPTPGRPPFWHSWTVQTPRRWAVAEQRCSVSLPLDPLPLDYGPHPHLHDHVGNSLFGLAFARLAALLGPHAPTRLTMSLAHLHAHPSAAVRSILHVLGAPTLPDSLIGTVASSIAGGPTNARRTPTLSRDSLRLTHPHLLQQLQAVLEADQAMFPQEWVELRQVLGQQGAVEV